MLSLCEFSLSHVLFLSRVCCGCSSVLFECLPGVMTRIGVPTPFPPIGGGDLINVFDNLLCTR